jgi:hypothetical protein
MEVLLGDMLYHDETIDVSIPAFTIVISIPPVVWGGQESHHVGQGRSTGRGLCRGKHA